MIGVVFTCILVACLIGVAIYCAYLHWYLIPDIMKNGLRAQESRLLPALFACFGPTVGLFMFAWTAKASIHWIAPTIGITIYGASVFVVMQCIFVCEYLLSSFHSQIWANMLFHRCPTLLPTIRSLPLRRKRFLPQRFRLWQYSFRSTSVHQLGNRKRCQCSWWP